MKNSEITVGVIGGGFVGRATARGWIEHVKSVRVYDVDPRRCTASRENVLDSDIIFVCLPTPYCELTEQFDTGAICDTLNGMPRRNRPYNLVIRSTVPVGCTADLAERRWSHIGPEDVSVVHNPEFLTARCAVVDFQIPARHIIGVPAVNLDQLKADEYACGNMLRDMLVERFPGVRIHTVSSTESELAKLAQNAFFATKVAFFNAIERIASDAGARFEAVRECLLTDGRIAHSHTAVPGPDGRRGFGGACLPKDTAELASYDESGILDAVLSYNHRQRMK